MKSEVILRLPVTAFWEVSNLCNLHCLHCYTNSGPAPMQKEKITEEDVCAILKDLSEHQIYSFGIGGGEPLLIPYILKMIEMINHYGMKASISTNGTMIDSKMAKSLKQSGLSAAQVSLDGLEANHERIRGKGNYAKTLEGIRCLIHEGISVRIAFTVNRINLDDIVDVTRLAKEIGADSIVFFRYMPTSAYAKMLDMNAEELQRAATHILQAKTYCEKMPRKSFMVYYERLSFLTFLLDEGELSQTGCLSGVGMCNITPAKNVTICPHLPKVIGCLNDEDLETIWEKMQLEKPLLNQIPGDCSMCKYAEDCRGGCKGISYIKYGDYVHKDDCCYIDRLL